MKMVINWENILKHVEKPARYLGGEWNEIRKDPQSVKAKIALVFPDVYEIGMSYLGQKILYSLLNRHPSLLAERVFSPWIDLEQELRSQNVPLCSLENKIPLFQFDIIGFSLLYELNYTNILTILHLGRIPLFSSERQEESPLVIAGGPAVFNPEPVADIFDFFLIGDGEEAFIEIVQKFLHLKKAGLDRKAALKEMAKIQGVYVPSLYNPYQPGGTCLLAVEPAKGLPEKIRKRLFSAFDQALFPENIVVPHIKAVFDRVSVEVERGCPQKCRFCQAASLYFPPRAKRPSCVVRNVLNSLCATGYEDASLASLSISDYPYLDEVVNILMENFEEKKISLSLPSLRPKGLTSGIARSILKVKKTGFTLVPEAGSERLRRVINKNLQDVEIFEAAENAFSQGWRLLKFYFMVGLPTETDEDLQGIASMVQEIIRIGYRILKTAPRINLSISSFIPKPHTPFQWLAMEEERILEEKHRFIKSRLRKYPFVRFKEHSLRASRIEAVFSRGDRRLNLALWEAWNRGARFDSWKDLFRYHLWKEAFEDQDIDVDLYLGTHRKDETLPWDHIDTGIKKSHLWQELERALEEKSTPSCLETSCRTCQGCSFPALIKRTYHEDIKRPEISFPEWGKKSDHIIRYRAFYSKVQNARFLSHKDLNHTIQRGFRRAGIPILHSRGFHPKMLISYLPALPLGMEGRREVLEFKSPSVFQEREFLGRINTSLPEGIRFIGLKKLEDHCHRLHQDLEAMIYSFDLKAPEIRGLFEIAENTDETSSEIWEKLEKRVSEFFLMHEELSFLKADVDRKSGKLLLRIPYPTRKGIRPQKIVEQMLGIKNSVFLMCREDIHFKKRNKEASFSP